MRIEKDRPLTVVERRLNESLASADILAICSAIREAAKAYNISDISRKTGVDRSNIYRFLGGEKDMHFSTVLRMLHAMGLDLQIARRPGEHAARAKRRTILLPMLHEGKIHERAQTNQEAREHNG